MKALQILEQITGLLLNANVAAPIITGVVLAIASIIKGVTGTGPSLPEIADMLDAQIGKNDTLIRDEIARLEALP